MKASDVVSILVDPDNIVTTSVTVPEGLAGQGRRRPAGQEHRLQEGRVRRGPADPEALGLPGVRRGQPGGLPVPGHLRLRPGGEAGRHAARHGRPLAAGGRPTTTSRPSAEALGYTPQEIMTIASLIEAEGRGDYRTKISRVIYNRLEIEPNPSAGYLQIDASVNYALDRTGSTVITEEDKESVADSPYNTYTQKGLPPTPDRGARRRRDPGGAAPRGRAVVLLRDGEPQDGRDQVHRRLRRVPRVQAGVPGVLRDPVRPVLRSLA